MSSYKIGDVVTGKVTGIENYGIFIVLANGDSGLIHISEISRSFVKNVGDYANIDEVIKARIIGMEDDNHYKLSIIDLDYREKKKWWKGMDSNHRTRRNRFTVCRV